MIKIMLTVRNRLSITKKCIQALYKHSTYKFQLYVYDNQSNYLVKEHFNFLRQLYEKKLVSQITFNTNDSTFTAFSKAVSCNQFGLNHEQDPNKDKVKFLLFLDNDIIVTKDWDKKILDVWKFINSKPELENIKVVSQFPGGIKQTQKFLDIKNMPAKLGKLGGSGFWTVRNNFFRDVGYLDLNKLVGCDKKHDQLYWQKMDRKVNGKPYILGLQDILAYHVGSHAGSVCNRLTRNRGNEKNKLQVIKFERQEKEIDEKSFDEFFKFISTSDIQFSRW